MDVDTTTATFQALGDPTRQELLLILRDGERSASELARPFPSTRSAVSQHLAVLREAGLVERRKEGRRQLYRLRPEPLAQASKWIGRFDAFWSERLERLGRYLEQEERG